MKKIRGTSTPGLKGKTARKKSKHVELQEGAAPARAKEDHSNSVAPVDVMLMSRIPFLTALVWHTHHGTITPSPQATRKLVIQSLTKSCVHAELMDSK